MAGTLSIVSTPIGHLDDITLDADAIVTNPIPAFDPSISLADTDTGTGAARAAEEYAYVGRDVRRITLLGGSLIVLMLVLWVVAHATGAGPV